MTLDSTVAADIRTRVTTLQGLAASLQSTAIALTLDANTLDPPESFAGFHGPADPAHWTGVFLDDFNNRTSYPSQLAVAGSTGDYGCYPTSYTSTDHNGIYDPANAVVQEQASQSHVLRCNLQPASVRPEGKPAGTTWYPQVGGSVIQSSVGLRVSVRYRMVPPTAALVNGAWHSVNMLYCVPGSNWPGWGEIDWMEKNITPGATADHMSAFFHNEGATTGGDQQPFPDSSHPSPTIDLTQWHTYTLEWITATSIKLYIDGDQKFDTTTRVPAHLMRILFQHESVNSPELPAAVEYDWVAVWTRTP